MGMEVKVTYMKRVIWKNDKWITKPFLSLEDTGLTDLNIKTFELHNSMNEEKKHYKHFSEFLNDTCKINPTYNNYKTNKTRNAPKSPLFTSESHNLLEGDDVTNNIEATEKFLGTFSTPEPKKRKKRVQFALGINSFRRRLSTMERLAAAEDKRNWM